LCILSFLLPKLKLHIYMCADVRHTQLLHFYAAVLKPVLELVAPIWHHLLTKVQTEQIEVVQRRPLRIIFSSTNNMPYTNALYCAYISSLTDHGRWLSHRFLKSILEPSSCLHSLLPMIRRSKIGSRIPNMALWNRYRVSHKVFLVSEIFLFFFVVVSKSSDIPRLSFKLPECTTAEKIEDCLISLGPQVNFTIFGVCC